MYDVLKLWELEDMSQKRDALFNGCNNISRHGGKGKHPGVGLARIGGANGTIDVKTGKMEREIAYRKYGIPAFSYQVEAIEKKSQITRLGPDCGRRLSPLTRIVHLNLRSAPGSLKISLLPPYRYCCNWSLTLTALPENCPVYATER
jgi:hypothetical protein